MMNKILTTAAFLLAAFSGQAQLKIGLPAGAPAASAILDASNTGATTKTGFLGPQVQLTGTNDASTILNPATGLMVYNVANAGIGSAAVTAGYYFFDGSKWKPFLSEVPASQTAFDASVLGYTPSRTATAAPMDTIIGSNRFIKKWTATNADNGHSYALYVVRNTANSANISLNWYTTFNFGKAISGYLLTLTNNTETNFIKTNFLSNNSLSLDAATTVANHSNENIWMGFAKIVEPGNPVRLGWITGERSKVDWSVDPSATETNFNTNEPNNNNGTEGYVHIWCAAAQATRTWNDAQGSVTLAGGNSFRQVLVEFNN